MEPISIFIFVNCGTPTAFDFKKYLDFTKCIFYFFLDHDTFQDGGEEESLDGKIFNKFLNFLKYVKH